MTSHPEMVSGYGEFDCELMKAGVGKIVCKRGAEGYQIIGLMPGVLNADSPGVGIAFKVSDGDASRTSLDLVHVNRVRPAVTLEILRQLGVLSSKQETGSRWVRTREVHPEPSRDCDRGVPSCVQVVFSLLKACCNDPQCHEAGKGVTMQPGNPFPDRESIHVHHRGPNPACRRRSKDQ
jgi:hypothetical protein